jgi:hypothetical protein
VTNVTNYNQLKNMNKQESCSGFQMTTRIQAWKVSLFSRRRRRPHHAIRHAAAACGGRNTEPSPF